VDPKASEAVNGVAESGRPLPHGVLTGRPAWPEPRGWMGSRPSCRRMRIEGIEERGYRPDRECSQIGRGPATSPRTQGEGIMRA
jgi:hypothetical protein